MNETEKTIANLTIKALCHEWGMSLAVFEIYAEAMSQQTKDLILSYTTLDNTTQETVVFIEEDQWADELCNELGIESGRKHMDENKFQLLYDINLEIAEKAMQLGDVDGVSDTLDFLVRLRYIAGFVGATITTNEDREQALDAFVEENF
jgi:hypothetical protein